MRIVLQIGKKLKDFISCHRDLLIKELNLHDRVLDEEQDHCSALCRHLVKDKNYDVCNVDKLTYAGIKQS